MDCADGSTFCPAMRQLLKESTKRPPNKVTVQVGAKGLKLVQNVPTMSKQGKLKMEMMKFQIPAHSITFSVVGPPPFNDVVACIMLVFNPETKCPVHVHCYRCDSAETAAVMHANLQQLLNRKEAQRHIGDLEHRLLVNGLIGPPKKTFDRRMSPSEFLSTRHFDSSGPLLDFSRQSRCYTPPTTDSKTASTEESTSNQSSPNQHPARGNNIEDARYVGLTSSSDDEPTLRGRDRHYHHHHGYVGRRQASPSLLPQHHQRSSRYVPPPMDSMHRSLFQELKEKLRPKEQRAYSTDREAFYHRRPSTGGAYGAAYGAGEDHRAYDGRRRGSIDPAHYEVMLLNRHENNHTVLEDHANASSTSGLGSSEDSPKKTSPAATDRRARHYSGPCYAAPPPEQSSHDVIVDYRRLHPPSAAAIPPSVTPVKYRKNHNITASGHSQQMTATPATPATPQLRMFGDTLKFTPKETPPTNQQRAAAAARGQSAPFSRQPRCFHSPSSQQPPQHAAPLFANKARRFRSMDNLHVETSGRSFDVDMHRRQTSATQKQQRMVVQSAASGSTTAQTQSAAAGAAAAVHLRAPHKDKFWQMRSKHAASWYTAAGNRHLID